MKLGIVGSGMIVHDVLPVLKRIPEIQLQAIFGLASDITVLEQLQDEYKIQEVFIEYEDFLASTEFDTVYIALPNNLHFAFSKQALEAGKHVICEKPFTSNLNELEQLIDIANQKPVFLLEAITNQYSPNYQAIRELMPELGAIKLIEANYSQYSSRYDAFKNGTILPAFDRSKSGGALMDLNSYNVHFVAGLLGAPNAVQYAANIEQAIDTSGILMFDYGSTKAVCIGAKDCAATSFVTIQGENGTIHVDGAANVLPEFTHYDRKSGTITNYNYEADKHRMYDEFVAFTKMLAANDVQQMQQRLEHSRNVMQILTQARISAGIIFPADE
ncbi:Gfo/Idh/MocA family protein [Culicoidibacter larvae]|uniref:Gfo/Idh/MocA family oxidoreductase n=1 Tax=Culicoidibacter larvae TaxID=2579976 RepID=A0A5R8QDW3_9FIRM|nr:Gfo/Idh/MocA family oxidoreductase [Culicoidibacter larvae]TLG74193.1 Gfo/Idh/MocA family oxidoreductase [Culicoidibacter larvae]